MLLHLSIDKDIDAFIARQMENECHHPVLNLVQENPEIEIKVNPFTVLGITGFDKDRELLCFRGEGTNVSWPPAPLARRGDNYIDDAVDWVVTSIRDAANNLSDSRAYRSYSKSLGVSLFKYCPGNAKLVLAKLPLNQMDMDVRLLPQGEKKHHCYIPMCLMAAKRYLHSLLGETAEDDTVCNIDLTFTGFTAEVSTLSRKNLDMFLNSCQEETFKRLASYQKDLEIISTRANYDYEIDDRDAIDLLRFLYILCIAGFDNAHKRIWTAYRSGELGIDPFSKKSEEGLRYVYLEYLCSPDEQDRGRDREGVAFAISDGWPNPEHIVVPSVHETNRDFERRVYQHLFAGIGSPWEFPTFQTVQSETEKRESIAKLFYKLKTQEAYPNPYIKVKPFKNDALFNKLMDLFLQED